MSELTNVRRQNLRLVQAELGGTSALAKRVKRSASQVSQLCGRNPIKNIGDDLARSLEAELNKPAGWLDVPQWDDGGLSVLAREVADFSPREAQVLRQAIRSIKAQRPGSTGPDESPE